MYPAGEPGISTRYVTIPNGTRIRVIESGPVGGPPLLLVHGWGACVYTFSELIPALAAAGYRAIAMDLPGQGLSDKPADESSYTTRAIIDAVLAVAAAVGAPRFTFVGHSMGGAIGLQLALAKHSAVTRLVLVNAACLGNAPIIWPARLFSPRFTNRFAPALLTRATIRLILNVAFGTRARPTERDIDEYWATTQFDENAWGSRALLHRFNFTALTDDELHSLHLPVLVIAGGRDRLVFQGPKRAGKIPNARIVSIPEGGHLVLQECAPKVNGEILAFLEKAAD